MQQPTTVPPVANIQPVVPWLLASRRRLFGTLILALGVPMAGFIAVIDLQVRRSLESQAVQRD